MLSEGKYDEKERLTGKPEVSLYTLTLCRR
jgi:hypothetical protein